MGQTGHSLYHPPEWQGHGAPDKPPDPRREVAWPSGGVQHHTENPRGGNESQHQLPKRKHSKMDEWDPQNLLVSYFDY